MRVRRALLAGAACFGVALTAAPLLLRYRAPVVPGPAPDPRHVQGALHVHSGRSLDGLGTLEAIAEQAAQAGLRYIVVTDHDQGRGRHPSDTDAYGLYEPPSYRQGVLVITGLEKSTTGGHALVLGTGPLPWRLDGDPRTVIDDATARGGFVVAAHPTSSREESSWPGSLDGVAGLEVLNLADPLAWPRGWRTAALLPLFVADPRGALLRALSVPRPPVTRWDRVLAGRPLAGLLGSDAHGSLGRSGLPWPTHAQVFSVASQHLLLERPPSGDPALDERLVLAAVRVGRGWVGLDGLADTSSFRMEAEGGGRRAAPGEPLPFEGEARLRASVAAPAGASLSVWKDGSSLHSRTAAGDGLLSLELEIKEPGVYRVLGWLPRERVPGRQKAWIIANPIHVFPAERLAERARPAAQPSPEPPGTALPWQPGPRWQTDADPSSRAAAGVEGEARRLDLALGPREPVHAALADWGARDLSRARAIAFRVRTSRPFRFDLQVRLSDAKAAGGVRIWRRSVKGEPTEREVQVPLASLQTYDRDAGAPDFSKVAGVFFQVDEAHLPPGASAALWISGLAELR